jgi:hypothetical protein
MSLLLVELNSPKGKAIPVRGREGPYGCGTSKLPHFLYTVSSQMAVRLSALRAGRPLPPQEDSWYSFLLEAESTPGP